MKGWESPVAHLSPTPCIKWRGATARGQNQPSLITQQGQHPNADTALQCHSAMERSTCTGYQKFPKPHFSEKRPLQSHWHSQKPYSCLTHSACHLCIALLRKGRIQIRPYHVTQSRQSGTQRGVRTSGVKSQLSAFVSDFICSYWPFACEIISLFIFTWDSNTDSSF